MMRAAALVVLAAVLLAPLAAAGQDASITKVLMKKGDRLYNKRASGASAKEAQTTYEKVLAVDAENVEARWKLARVFYWHGTHEASTDAQLKLFESGIRYAQESIERDPKCVECQFWLGVSYGKYGEAKGILQSLGLVPHVQTSMEFVLKAKPKYEWGGAYRVLGRLYHKLPAIKGGDNDKAIEYQKKAIAIGPTHLMNHRFLAEVLLDEGKKDEAKAELELIINMPEADLLPAKKPEMKEEQDLARKLLKENFGQ